MTDKIVIDRDTTIKLAHEAECLDESHYGSLWVDRLVAFAALIAAADPQPPRQPLTEDEINTIWRNSTHMTIVEVVRAIEAAHGIGGES